MSTRDTSSSRPWYRERWVWLLMIPPAASVVAGVTMGYLAVSVPAALVVDDYARIEQISGLRFARDRRAAELGLHAHLAFAASGNGLSEVVAIVTAAESVPLSETLTLRLSHATTPSADRLVTLTRAGSRYTARVDLAGGRYEVEVLPPDLAWRLGGSLSRAPGTLELAALRDEAP